MLVLLVLVLLPNGASTRSTHFRLPSDAKLHRRRVMACRIPSYSGRAQHRQGCDWVGAPQRRPKSCAIKSWWPPSVMFTGEEGRGMTRVRVPRRSVCHPQAFRYRETEEGKIVGTSQPASCEPAKEESPPAEPATESSYCIQLHFGFHSADSAAPQSLRRCELLTMDPPRTMQSSLLSLPSRGHGTDRPPTDGLLHPPAQPRRDHCSVSETLNKRRNPLWHGPVFRISTIRSLH